MKKFDELNKKPLSKPKRKLDNRNHVEGYSELSKLDKIIYDNGKKMCESCPGLERCEQPIKGHYPIIIKDKTFKSYRLAYVKCDKTVGRVNDKTLLESKFDTTEVDGEVVKNVMKSLKNKRSLYIFGKVGVGKTHLAKYLGKIFYKKGANVYINKMRDINDEYFQKEDYNNEKSFLSRLKNVDVLIIDDLGNEFITDWIVSSLIFPIIDYRLAHKKVTIITSNYNVPNELGKRYNDSGKISNPKSVAPFISRIDGNEIYDKYEIKGRNFRQD